MDKNDVILFLAAMNVVLIVSLLMLLAFALRALAGGV